MKNFTKLILLGASIITLASCNFAGSSSSDHFLVDLNVSDEYRLEDFTEAFGKYKDEGKISYRSDNVTLDVHNLMPHNLFDEYGIGLYKVRAHDGEQTYDDAYLYFNKEVCRVSPVNIRSNKEGFAVYGSVISVAFTDMNKDSNYEVTVCYEYEESTGKSTQISTLDTMSREIVSSEIFRGQMYFKERLNAIAIYFQEKNSTGYEFLGNINPYIRDYEIVKPSITLESTNYSVKVTWAKFETNVPVDYPGLTHRFKVETDMTWTGESFTYEGSYYLDGARPTFYKDNYQLQQPEIAVDTGLKEHNILHGQHIVETYYFLDKYELKNQFGIYDMKISYRGEEVSQPNVLKIK